MTARKENKEERFRSKTQLSKCVLHDLHPSVFCYFVVVLATANPSTEESIDKVTVLRRNP